MPMPPTLPAKGRRRGRFAVLLVGLDLGAVDTMRPGAELRQRWCRRACNVKCHCFANRLPTRCRVSPRFDLGQSAAAECPMGWPTRGETVSWAELKGLGDQRQRGSLNSAWCVSPLAVAFTRECPVLPK